ncbi:NAD-dependent epimerase/dehydratase [Corchorus olitorius]|uniref:NAD-dependent epimerase/dehydratase n=1 Tax=Corchorus olitorius TaxID=93759 RepID=A0A1R3H3V5_9ROSI|nr:NAD-dependent epimerase/dehydratase [Corchorus olitorius]
MTKGKKKRYSSFRNFFLIPENYWHCRSHLFINFENSHKRFGILGTLNDRQRRSYACAKQLIERLIYAEGAENGLEFTINLLRGEPLKLVNGGQSQRTFVYVKDAVEAVLLMIENPQRANGHIFNVGNPNNEVTVRQLADMMTEVYSKVSGVPALEKPTVDVSSKEFYLQAVMNSVLPPELGELKTLTVLGVDYNMLVSVPVCQAVQIWCRKPNKAVIVVQAAKDLWSSKLQRENTENWKLVYNRAKYMQMSMRHRCEKELIQLKGEAKLNGGFYVDPEAKLLFIIRIRGIHAMHPRTRKILQLLCLRQIFNGVFLKVNKATMNMLHRVEPYVTYGYPNWKSVRELIYKRGYGKLNKLRIALTDNSIVDQAFGYYLGGWGMGQISCSC